MTSSAANRRKVLLGAGALLTALLVLGAWYWFDEDESQFDIQLTTLDAQERAALRKSKVPLLVPKDLRPGDSAVASENSYTINTKRKGGYYAISGTTVTHYTLEELGFDKPPDSPYRVNGRPAFVNNAHDVLLGITWSEGGAHYALDVECPIGELNCISPEELVKEAERLTRVDNSEGETQSTSNTTFGENSLRALVAHLLAAISQSAQAQPAEVALWNANPPRDPGVLVDGSGQRGEADFASHKCGVGNTGFVGKGIFTRNHVFAPDIIFPIQNAPAYANSQVYGPGILHGVECATAGQYEYSYPWGDNFCEHRGKDTATSALCPIKPTGKTIAYGHQGQDIRAMDTQLDVHPIVAVVAGTITNIGNISITLESAQGVTKYRYLHGKPNTVTLQQQVNPGDVITHVSNIADNGGLTTRHLHFEIRRTVADHGFAFLPPYTSLIKAYQKLIGVPAPRCTVPAFPSCTFPMELE